MPKVKVGTEKSTAVELYYEDHGAGKPVVLIHGWPLSGRSWEPQIPALISAGHRVITYDRRGFGWSTQTWSGYDYDTFAADLDALLQQLDVKGATLVGFSMGGGEVARYIAKYGTGRVAKAVFAAAIPPYLFKSQDNPDGAFDEATVGQFQSGVRKDRLEFVDEFTKGFFSAGGKLQVSEVQRIYARDIAAFASPKGTVDCITAFSRTDFRGDLKKVAIPTLIIHGDSDAIVPFQASGKRTNEAIKGSQLALIKGGPHGLNLSHAEPFNKALIEFLGR
jgi:pimeloyl-ACP methyl ester carboxylesterase